MSRGALVYAVSLAVCYVLGYVVFLKLFADGLSVHTHDVSVYQATLCQFVHYAEYAARAVTFLHAVLLRVGRKLAQAWNLSAKCVYVFHVEVGACFLRYGEQMKHGVGASAHRYVESHGVEEGRACGDVARQHALVAVFIISDGVCYNLSCSVFEQAYAVFMCGKDCAVAGKSQSDGFCQ